MKKALVLLSLLLVLVLLLVSCGGGGSKPADEDSCTVTFKNTDMSNQTIKKGSALNRPADPQKNNYVFGGWYADAGFTTPVQFPVTINEDTTLYAMFYDFGEAFAAAREKTIGSAVPGYEYDYTLDVKVKYNGVALSGLTEGNAKYSSSGEVSFYDVHTNSGLLFYDGTGYQIKRGDLLLKLDSSSIHTPEDLAAKLKTIHYNDTVDAVFLTMVNYRGENFWTRKNIRLTVH